MDEEESEELLEALERAGWTWRDGVLGAPNETMWLDRDLVSWGDRASFCERMIGRRDRIRASLEAWPTDAADLQPALADVESLIDVLRRET